MTDTWPRTSGGTSSTSDYSNSGPRRRGRLRRLLRFDLVDLATLGGEVQLAFAVLTERGNSTHAEASMGRCGPDELAVLDRDRLDRAARPGRIEVPAAEPRDLAPAVDHA